MWNHSPPKVSSRRPRGGSSSRAGSAGSSARAGRSRRARPAPTGLLVLVEDLHVPAGHRLAHRALADLHPRVVGDQRIGLGQPVVVEHGQAVLLAEPADRLGVQRLARRADAAELLRVARRPASSIAIIERIAVGVVKTFVTSWRREEVELLVRVEAALALEDALHRAEAPRPEQRRDPGRPGPLAHAVEALAVLHLVAVDELLVREQVAVGVDDALGQAGGAGRVVELGRVVGGGVDRLELGRRGRRAGRRRARARSRDASKRARVGRVGDQHLRAASRSGGGGCRRRRRAPTSRAAARRASRCRRTPPPSPASAGSTTATRSPRSTPGVAQHVGGLRWRGPAARPSRSSRTVAVEVLVHHRELVARVLVADVGGDVVALRDMPMHATWRTSSWLGTASDYAPRTMFASCAPEIR